jgi:hypothetical protein
VGENGIRDRLNVCFRRHRKVCRTRSKCLLTADSVEKVENRGFLIFAFGTKYRKPPLNLLALTHRCIRIAMIEN